MASEDSVRAHLVYECLLFALKCLHSELALVQILPAKKSLRQWQRQRKRTRVLKKPRIAWHNLQPFSFSLQPASTAHFKRLFQTPSSPPVFPRRVFLQPTFPFCAFVFCSQLLLLSSIFPLFLLNKIVISWTDLFDLSEANVHSLTRRKASRAALSTPQTFQETT